MVDTPMDQGPWQWNSNGREQAAWLQCRNLVNSKLQSRQPTDKAGHKRPLCKAWSTLTTDDKRPNLLRGRLFHTVLLRRQITLKFHAFRMTDEKLHLYPTALSSTITKDRPLRPISMNRRFHCVMKLGEERNGCLRYKDVTAMGSIWAVAVLH